MSEWSDREADARQEGEDFMGERPGEEGGPPEPTPGEGGGGAMGEESYAQDVDEEQ